MRALYVGYLLDESSTSVHRGNALARAIKNVDKVNMQTDRIYLNYRLANFLFRHRIPCYLPDRDKCNQLIKKMVDKNVYDIVWIDKGLEVKPSTLKYIKNRNRNTVIINYSPDNMALRHNQSQQFIDCVPLYDLHVTTKSYIIGDLKKLGARDVLFTFQKYEPGFHYPHEVDDNDIAKFGGDVGFIGTFERDRLESILYLTRNGIKVRVFGGQEWQEYKDDNPNLIIENGGLYNENYAKSFKCFKISLCFLRKLNFDLHTSRSVEIPACGGFMLAERTKEHEELFEEGIEAEYFGDNEELLRKCRYYLEHEDERKAIAQKGYERCLKSDYSTDGLIKEVFKCINDNI
ncbi:MAG: glycosyltransferase [Treponema sp.]|nr:glycosyltransferase [Treponema sp.]